MVASWAVSTLTTLYHAYLTRADYQGLIPWAWIEASTKGAVLLFVASEAEYYTKTFGANNFVAGISGGMFGGLAQAFTSPAHLVELATRPDDFFPSHEARLEISARVRSVESFDARARQLLDNAVKELRPGS